MTNHVSMHSLITGTNASKSRMGGMIENIFRWMCGLTLKKKISPEWRKLYWLESCATCRWCILDQTLHNGRSRWN